MNIRNPIFAASVGKPAKTLNSLGIREVTQGKKPNGCSDCGKIFSHKSAFIKH